jgi:predicted nucleic acid-binding protein
MIHLDTSALVASLCGTRSAAPVLRGFIADGIRLGISTLVLYEWLRGPRVAQELAAQELLFRGRMRWVSASPGGARRGSLSPPFHAPGPVPSTSIAACAISNGAAFWTTNPRDFADIPGLTLADW